MLSYIIKVIGLGLWQFLTAIVIAVCVSLCCLVDYFVVLNTEAELLEAYTLDLDGIDKYYKYKHSHTKQKQRATRGIVRCWFLYCQSLCFKL
jgi:hypothetical protein